MVCSWDRDRNKGSPDASAAVGGDCDGGGGGDSFCYSTGYCYYCCLRSGCRCWPSTPPADSVPSLQSFLVLPLRPSFVSEKKKKMNKIKTARYKKKKKNQELEANY